MSPSTDHDPLQALFAPARAAEPTAAEVHAVVRATAPPAAARRSPRLRPSPALAAAVLAAAIGLGYVTAPPLRAAVDSVAGTFSGWVDDDDPATGPGRPLRPGDEAPDYMRDGFVHDTRVIAEAGGYKLFAARGNDGTFEFDLGNTGVGLGGYTAKSFDEKPVYVFGPGAMRRADVNGHVPLFGVTARSVKSVELTYERGPSLRLDDVEGAFVLLAEPERAPVAVVARGADGRQITRVLVDDSRHECPCIDWTHFLPREQTPAEQAGTTSRGER